MTARESVVRRLRWSHAFFVLGMTVTVVGVGLHNVWGNPGAVPGYAVAPGIAVIFGGVIYLYYGVRCPYCRGSLGPLFESFGIWPWQDSFQRYQVRYCPYCGTDLDTEAAPFA